MPSKFKILSLDGGGTWALAQVKCLKNIYPNLSGHEILQKFDLVVANSGGSIVLASLLENLSPAETEALFLDTKFREKIFVRIPIYRKIGTKLLRLVGVGPKYWTHKKLDGFRQAFPNTGDSKLEDIVKTIKQKQEHCANVLIITYDYDRSRSVFLRSNDKSRTNSALEPAARARIGRTVDHKFKSITLAEAVHSSSNAPVNYFDKPALVHYGDRELRAWDGAIGGYNNPILAGLTEALRNKTKLEDIYILSIGTANKVLPLESILDIPKAQSKRLFIEVKKPNFTRDLSRLALSILNEPPESALYVTHTFMASQFGNDMNADVKAQRHLIRMNPLVQPVVKEGEKGQELAFPEGISSDEFKRIIDLDMDLIKQADVELINKLFDLWLEDKVVNQPIRQDSRNLRALIGSLKFSEVKKTWLEVSED